MINKVGTGFLGFFDIKKKQVSNEKKDCSFDLTKAKQQTSRHDQVLVQKDVSFVSSKHYSEIKRSQAQAVNPYSLILDGCSKDRVANIVEKAITGQRKSTDILHGENNKYASAKAIAEAKMAIGEDGAYGVKAVSNGIVQFAIAQSGSHGERLGTMREAIKQGFAAAEESFGDKLPDICHETYDAIFTKLDQYQSSIA